MRVPVLNAGWWQQIGISAATMHDQYLPPPPPFPPLPGIPTLLEVAPLGLPVAQFLHKKARTVVVDGGPGIQQGHDIGYCIPHAAIPLNALMAVHTLLSKHKVLIPVSSVLLEGKPVGTYLFGQIGGLICANPISLPTGALIRVQCTVETSATIGDILKGLAYIAIEIVFDLVWNKIKGGLPKFTTDVNAKWLQAYLEPLKGTSLGDILRTSVLPELKELVAVELGNKVLQHLMKSWVANPLFSGGLRGTTGIGRGAATWKPVPFDKELW